MPRQPTSRDRLCESEIHKFEVAFAVNQNIFRLQVTICDAFRIVKELKTERHLRSIEASSVFIEIARPS